MISQCDITGAPAPCSLRHLCLALLLGLTPVLAWGQATPNTGADAVHSYAPGEGGGYGMQYFPGNVLGFPDSTARADLATVEPAQVLGLGLGGEIILRFDRHIIVDGPGPDFTVFENAFNFTIGGKTRIYAEPGEVAVSRDGVNFVAYRYDSATLQGSAGVTPTNGEQNPADPSVSGGDRFDLHDLGIDSVRFIRIRDVTNIVKDNRNHPFWDPTLTGFDLDAIVAVNAVAAGPAGVDATAERERLAVSVAPNPIAARGTVRLHLAHGADVRMRLIDPLGRQVRMLADGAFDAGEYRIPLDAYGLPNGLYLITIDLGGALHASQRVVISR